MSPIPAVDLSRAYADLGSEMEEAVRRVLRSGRYVLGPEVEGFEQGFAEYCGVAGAVGVGNGLEALQLALSALGIGQGDEVIVPSHTSIATWLAVTHAGARPVPVEPYESTMQIDTSAVESAIGPRTAAIVPVHLYGMPVDMARIAAIGRRHGIAVVEDASQAHGARLDGQTVGSFGDAAAFSLYPTKNLGGVGDAGVVVSDDGQLLERIRTLANYGERKRHDSVLRGFNSRLDELQAALLRVKMPHLDRWNDSRRSVAARYLSRLGGSLAVRLPGQTDGASPVWHQFVVRVQDRDRVRKSLGRSGVEALVHYPIAPHRSGAYADEPWPDLPIAERLAATVLSLPISPYLDEADCERVCDALETWA